MTIPRCCSLFFRPFRLVRRRTLLLCTFAFTGCMLFYNWVNTEYGNPYGLNYFLDDGGAPGTLEYVVDTEHCKILKLSPWEPAILDFIKPKITPPDCSQRNNGRKWVYVKDSKIYINESAVIASGYSMSSVRCCYKGIIRVTQSLEKFDLNADNQVEYTSTCTPLEKVTPLPDHDFARVFCTSTSWPYLGEVVYREYVAIPAARKAASRAKVAYWATTQTRPLPPSVVMLGIDSLSRMNYHRSFNLTKTFLDGIGAVEMLGYTKVGENTFPNTAAFLTGFDPAIDSELLEGCISTRETPQDFCPYIWKRFSDANYLTATVEDAPGLVGFNYLKVGFVQEPTDFYFRPFMLQVHKSLPRKDYYHTDCIGTSTTEETLLSYISSIMSHSSSAPVFIHSWLTSLAHLDINGARYADATVANFLSRVDLSNTILIFLSDHGQRYGAIRETLPGWYEDKLPVLSIYLPATVKASFPAWVEALNLNAARLSSPFDLYQMMSHVLDAYSGPENDGRGQSGKYENMRDQALKFDTMGGKSFKFDNTRTLSHVLDAYSASEKGDTARSQFGTSRARGQSLFTPISPLRRCSDAGVKTNFCACLPPKKVNASDNPLVLQAAFEAVKYLNGVIPKTACVPVVLDKVVAAAVMQNGAKASEGTFLVTFYTNPGQFMFEATVDFGQRMGRTWFNVTTDLLRMNKIERRTDCVDTSLLERYCYCK